MSKKRKIRSDVASKGKVVSCGFDSAKSKPLVFDFSSPSAWRSCKMGDFNSYLADEIEFVDKFRSAMKLVQTLSSHKPAEVFNSGAFNHCHVISDDETKTVVALLTSKLGVSEQLIEGETLMQVGLDGGFRMVGAHTDGVFCVYLVDYNHSVYYDERKNRSNKANRKFCPITGRK